MYSYLIVVMFAVRPCAFLNSDYSFPPSAILRKQFFSFSFQMIAGVGCLLMVMVADDVLRSSL